MKRALVNILIIVSFILLGCPSFAIAKSLTGRQIIDKMAAKNDLPAEIELQKMVLVDKKGNKTTRELKRYSLEGANKLYKYLLVFTQPSGIKGVALLTWQMKDGADQQWMLMPARGNHLQRIAKGSKRNYFLGTDFTYEDLSSDDKDDFSYKNLGDVKVGGKVCYKVKVTPINPIVKKTSGYQYRVLYIRHDIDNIARVDFYNRRGKLIKKKLAGKYKRVHGDATRAFKIMMYNIRKKHKTFIYPKHFVFGKDKVLAKMFTHQYLLSGQYK